MRLSKKVTEHAAVLECDYGPDVGIDDYKYSVFLKEGWVFSSGRMEGGRMGNFNSISDFIYAKPVKIK